MASLYADGWRQGSIIQATLPLDGVVLDGDGRPCRDQSDHGSWAVASQDCDLDKTDADHHEPTVELRAVFTDKPPEDWGLRSWRLRLTETDYVVSHGPRTVVSAAVLTALVQDGSERRDVDASRRLAFTTWLGLRYDRPAVPPELVPLAQRISAEVARRSRRPTGAVVRDVLMQFDESETPPLFSLYAVLENDADRARVEEWLGQIALAVPDTLGTPSQLQAATSSGISLYLVENSYAADVTQVTWRPSQPDPEGAV